MRVVRNTIVELDNPIAAIGGHRTLVQHYAIGSQRAACLLFATGKK
jgi:hypothetical protein